MNRLAKLSRNACVLFLMAAMPAHAYVGPGLGAGTIGVILGLLLSILVAIFALFWYPIKRILGIAGKHKNKKDDREKVPVETEAEQTPTESERTDSR